MQPKAIEKFLNVTVLEDPSPDLFDDPESVLNLQSSLLRMDVYFKTLSTQVITESSKYTVGQGGGEFAITPLILLPSVFSPDV